MGRSKQRVTARAKAVLATSSSFIITALSTGSSQGCRAQHDPRWAGQRRAVGHVPHKARGSSIGFAVGGGTTWARGASDTREWSKPRKESSRAASWPQGSIHLEIFFPIVLGFARLHKPARISDLVV